MTNPNDTPPWGDIPPDTYRVEYSPPSCVGSLALIGIALAMAVIVVPSEIAAARIVAFPVCLAVLYWLHHRLHSHKVPICRRCGSPTNPNFSVCRACGKEKWKRDG